MLPTADDRAEIETLQSYLERNPDDPAALTRLAALMFMHPPFNEEHAETLFRRAIAVDPKNTDARFWLAQMLVCHCVQFQKAIEVLREAVSVDTRRADCLALLAYTLKDEREPPEIYIPLLERALRESPDWPIPRRALAAARYESGKSSAMRLAMDFFSDDVPEIPTPTDSLEKYYESVVTGRISDNDEFLAPHYCAVVLSRWGSTWWGSRLGHAFRWIVVRIALLFRGRQDEES